MIEHLEHILGRWLARTASEAIRVGFRRREDPGAMGNACGDVGRRTPVELMRTRGYAEPLIEKFCLQKLVRVLRTNLGRWRSQAPCSGREGSAAWRRAFRPDRLDRRSLTGTMALTPTPSWPRRRRSRGRSKRRKHHRSDLDGALSLIIQSALLLNLRSGLRRLRMKRSRCRTDTPRKCGLAQGSWQAAVSRNKWTILILRY